MLHQIGSGMLGPVFRTYDDQRDRLVAIKAIAIDLVPEDAARLAEAFHRLAGESVAHPAIVRVIDAGLEGTVPFLALEYASGDSLDVMLRQSGAMTLDAALPILAEVAQALDQSWTSGAGHGALHPRDLFVAPGGDGIRITGVGIAAALETIGAKAPIRRPYSAPERIAGSAWDERADVYSLAVIACELLTGNRPTGPGDPGEIMVADLGPDAAAALRQVLASALAERPDDRFGSAMALVDAMAAVKAEITPRLPEPVATPLPTVDPASTQASVASGSPKKSRRTVRRPLEQMSLLSLPETDPAAEAGDEAPVELPAFVVPPRQQPPADLELHLSSPEAAPADTAPAEPSTVQPVRAVSSFPMAPEPVRQPAYPWSAIAAVLVAGVALGGVIGYAVGLKRGAAAPAVTAATNVQPAGDAAPSPPAEAHPQPPATAPGSTPAEVAVRPVAPPSDRRATSSAGPARSPAATRGTIVVDSRPRGARVRIDGRNVGVTPIGAMELPPGRHRVQIDLAGHRPVASTATVVAGQQTRVAVTLERGGESGAVAERQKQGLWQ